MPDKATIEEQIVAAIRRIIRAVDLHSRRLLERHGLTGPQLATLHEAARLGSVPAGTLAKAVHLSQATVSGILDRLERQGLVYRSRDAADRRTVIVSVTPMGRAILETGPSVLQDQFRHDLMGLAEWEQTMMLATLQRVAAMMESTSVKPAAADSVAADPPLRCETDDEAEPGEDEDVRAAASGIRSS